MQSSMLNRIEIDNLDNLLMGLSENKKKINSNTLNYLFENCCFYPASGTDPSPIIYLENFQSFVYCDYRYQSDEWANEMRQGLDGYRLIHDQKLNLTRFFNRHFYIENTNNISQIRHDIAVLEDALKGYKFRIQLHGKNLSSLEDLIKKTTNEINELESELHDLNYKFRNENLIEEILRETVNFSQLTIWQKGGRFLSIIYISSEAVHCYEQIFIKNKIAPKLISIIQPGHTMGGNWTNFFNSDSEFMTSISKGSIPKFMLLGCFGERDNYQQIDYDRSKFKKMLNSDKVIKSAFGEMRYVFLVSRS